MQTRLASFPKGSNYGESVDGLKLELNAGPKKLRLLEVPQIPSESYPTKCYVLCASEPAGSPAGV